MPATAEEKAKEKAAYAAVEKKRTELAEQYAAKLSEQRIAEIEAMSGNAIRKMIGEVGEIGFYPNDLLYAIERSKGVSEPL